MAAAAEVGCGLRLFLLLGLAASLNATTFYVTVAGLGGEPDYEQRFATWAQEIDKTLRASGDARVETLKGADATAARFKASLQGLAKEAKAEDTVVLMMIGHGAFDGVEYKINLPGPDLSGVDLAALLDRIPARQLVVNMTSASGGSVHSLLKPNRTVITATKTGTERNATVFARYWSEALRDAAADVDKNEVITAIEAFRFAEQKTKQFYETQKRLATEHAVLDGGAEESKLAAARIAVLRVGSLQQASKDPAKQALFAEREKLEAEIDRLKFQKAAVPAAEYRKQMSELLLKLAQTQAELDK
jgi:hypothetical protein